MDTKWVTPQAIVLTIEEVSEIANIDLACANEYNSCMDHS